MLSKHASLLAFGLAAIVVICATVLLMAGHAVPDMLWALAFGAITGGAGLAPGPATRQLP